MMRKDGPMREEELSPELSLRINALINAGILEELSRRGFIGRAAVGFGGLSALALGLAGCKTTGSELRNGPPADQIDNSRFGRIPLPVKRVDGSIVDVYVNGASFYDDADSITSQDGFQVTLAPNLQDVMFLAQAGNQGRAIGAVIGFYLAKRPYEMIEECLAKADQRAMFKPAYGPLFVFQHAHVIDILKRTNNFTVDPYTPMMAIASSGHPSMGAAQPPADSPAKWVPDPTKTDNSKYQPQWTPAAGVTPNGSQQGGYFNHYMLGTDQDDLYVPDAKISRYVVKRSDIDLLRPMIRNICESLVQPFYQPQQPVTFDTVTTICRFAPVLVVAQYLGLPSYKSGEAGDGIFRIDDKDGNALAAGSNFEIDDEMWARYKFKFLQKDGGVVPNHEDCYQWVKDTFRNIFNNFGDRFVRAADGSLEMKPDGSGPRNVREEWVMAGLQRGELLLAWSARVIAHYKKKIEAGEQVPDTMITRLIRLQKDALANPSRFMAEFSCYSEDELKARVADDRIQVNAFGCFVGAVANPEEANARIIDALLDLQDGALEAVNGSYDELRAEADKANPDMSLFNKYALEFLRLRPQGEVLLRVAVANTTVAGARVSPGTLIFNSHGAAMRDPKVLGADRLKFDSKRQDKKSSYQPVDGKDTRPDEDQQSVIYLQHGYGRHKCLGRYASEMTMEEVLRAVVRLGKLRRIGPLEMDPENLYAMKLEVEVSRPANGN